MVAKTLALSTRSGTPPTLPATINDDTKIPASAPLDCARILPNVKTDPSLSTSFSIPAVLANLQAFKNVLTDPNVLSTQTITGDDLTAINTYLTYLRNTDYPKIQQVANCVEGQNAGTNPLEIQAQEQITEESKSRLAAITAPETHVSYYESWFPRPMKQDAIFGLFGTALFLLLVSVAFFLGMSGVEFQILAPSWTFPGVDFTLLTSRTPVLVAGVGAGIIIGVVGRYLKWF